MFQRYPKVSKVCVHWCAPWLGGTGQAWNTELLRISELYFWYLYVSFGLLYILKRLKNVYNVLNCPLWQSTLGDALSSPITFWQFSMNCEEWSHSRVNPGGNSWCVQYVPVNLQHKILLWPLKILATMTSDPSQQISTHLNNSHLSILSISFCQDALGASRRALRKRLESSWLMACLGKVLLGSCSVLSICYTEPVSGSRIMLHWAPLLEDVRNII